MHADNVQKMERPNEVLQFFGFEYFARFHSDLKLH